MSIPRRLIIALVLAVFVFAAGPAVVADPAEASPKTAVKKKLETARAKIADANKRKEQLGTQIAALDKRLNVIEAELTRLKGRIAIVEEKLAVTGEKLRVLQEQLRLKRIELAKAEAKLELEQENFQVRVVVAYKTDELTYVDVVLASTSFEDLVSRTSVVRDLIGGNNELVGTLEEARNEVEREKQAIAENEREVHAVMLDLQEQSDELHVLRTGQSEQKAQSLAARRQKNSALGKVRSDIAVLKRQEAQLLAESKALSRVIRSSSGGGGSGGGTATGRMTRPVGGPVTSGFGWRTHPVLGYRKFHTGVDFGSGYGTPIRAADGGTVIHSTWMGGYGNVVIVNHGGGVSTLYAHQSSIAVGNGAGVSRGQVIGYVGSTGLSTGPHLHFEVRVNGNPVDPMRYIN